MIPPPWSVHTYMGKREIPQNMKDICIIDSANTSIIHIVIETKGTKLSKHNLPHVSFIGPIEYDQGREFLHIYVEENDANSKAALVLRDSLNMMYNPDGFESKPIR